MRLPEYIKSKFISNLLFTPQFFVFYKKTNRSVFSIRVIFYQYISPYELHYSHLSYILSIYSIFICCKHLHAVKTYHNGLVVRLGSQGRLQMANSSFLFCTTNYYSSRNFNFLPKLIRESYH